MNADLGAGADRSDIGGHFVKISASGPMPTSRYCDQTPCPISTSLSRIASGEPGRTSCRLSPITARIDRRRPSAFAASPRACSSITRSSRLATNVTPLAFTACRSHGASSHGARGSRPSCGRVRQEPRRPSRSAAGRPAERMADSGSSSVSSPLQVGATPDRSCTVSPRTTTGAGPWRAAARRGRRGSLARRPPEARVRRQLHLHDCSACFPAAITLRIARRRTRSRPTCRR